MALKKKKVNKRRVAKKRITRRKPARKPARKIARKPARKPVRKPAKKIARKPAKKALKKKAPAKKAKRLGKDVIGVVTHYFPKVRAAVIKLKAPLNVGDTVKIKGHTTDFKQAIASMQIDRVPLSTAKKGQEIGLLVDSRVRRHDVVSKA